MKRVLLACLSLGVLSLGAAEGALVKAADTKWGAHPFIKGGQLAVQSGDPTKGPSVLLMKFPKGMTIPAHTHTADETVTILSGSAIFGGGETVDKAKGTRLGAGGYLFIPGQSPHWAVVQQELVFTVTMSQAADFHLCGAAK
ncbi:MAG: cupin domain-containing protein [Geothrix sp.]|uniref:cupin domain-containing protein n=1 Tax=Geothrix sp. TaxID=1962974 RepID=UPI003BB203DC